MGFEWAYSLDGSDPIIQEFVVKASAVISAGEFCNLESNEADAGATNDTAFIGIAVEDVDNTVDGHTVRCIVNRFAVYKVADANARAVGDTLDLASGGQGVAASSNVDFLIVKSSSATEPTYVMVANGEHWLAQ
jgi:hypothetical protein